MSTNPHVMSKYATEIDCLRARDKWHQQRIAELERENAELLKDAERYRWLRDTHGYSYGMGSDTPAECGIAFGWQQSCPEESYWGIEQAIDAAIASEKENERG